MDYDAYGRPLRGGYFEDSSSSSTGYHDPRESLNTHHKWNHAQQRYSPPLSTTSTADRMANVPEPAMHKAHEGVSPDVVAQIKEQVMREVLESLKATGSMPDSSKSTNTAPPPPPPMQGQQPSSSNRSSVSDASPLPRRVYTPPSPVYQPPPLKNAYNDTSRSPPASPLDKPSVRFTDRAAPRPAATGKSYSTADLSTIDQKWGRLFDSEGNPTQRLGCFLRGLANHIIDDFTPKKSIVITPKKMAEFYTSHALDVEPNNILAIFKSSSHAHISRLYQALGCCHHLIQEHASQPCIIPSLTPAGFAHWMTLRILAYPEEEWRRLEKICIACPIDADGEMVDGKPERLPKQISRYLLPEVEDKSRRKLVDNSISDFLEDIGKSPPRKKSTGSPPPPLNRQPSLSKRRESSSQRQTRPIVELHQDIKSPTFATPNPIERERKPYSGAPGSDVSSNDDVASGIKIERERQPYTAQPGSGRTYDNLNPPDRGTIRDRANSASRPKEEFPDTRHGRTRSDARRETYMAPPPRQSGRRTSSPPLKSFSNSTPLDINSSSSSSYTATPTGFPPPNSTFSPRPYNHSSGFPPPPPPGERREAYTGRRVPDDNEGGRASSDFSSPRDAERWDRYQDNRRSDDGFGGSYERGSASGNGAGVGEEWYRDGREKRGGYDDFGGRRYG